MAPPAPITIGNLPLILIPLILPIFTKPLPPPPPPAPEPEYDVPFDPAPPPPIAIKNTVSTPAGISTVCDEVIVDCKVGAVVRPALGVGNIVVAINYS
jgi:hypothetical protein